jgi:hypothetical protein
MNLFSRRDWMRLSSPPPQPPIFVTDDSNSSSFSSETELISTCA